jgi:hypothetical protein
MHLVSYTLKAHIECDLGGGVVGQLGDCEVSLFVKGRIMCLSILNEIGKSVSRDKSALRVELREG